MKGTTHLGKVLMIHLQVDFYTELILVVFPGQCCVKLHCCGQGLARGLVATVVGIPLIAQMEFLQYILLSTRRKSTMGLILSIKVVHLLHSLCCNQMAIHNSSCGIIRKKLDGLSYSPGNDCDRYALCGPYGICNIDNSPRCECMRGFSPQFPDKWRSLDWSGGCVRKKILDCGTKVGFQKYSGVKLPDTRHSWHAMSINLDECQRLCLKNCSCAAYANADERRGGRGCFLWFSPLNDITGYSNDGQDIYVRMPAPELGKRWRTRELMPFFGYSLYHLP